MSDNELRQPTVRELKLVEGIAKGKTKRDAGVEAGYTGEPDTVSSTVSRVLKKDKVQQALSDAFEKHGIDIDSAIAPIGIALKGKRKVIVEGVVIEIDDIDLQLKGSDRALRLMGIGQQTGDVTINFITQSQEQRQVYDV